MGELNYKPKTHAFREDREANKKIFKGQDIYSLLDYIHYDIAYGIDAMPSGMMVLSAHGSQSMKSEGTHPIIKRIKLEQNYIRKGR